MNPIFESDVQKLATLRKMNSNAERTQEAQKMVSKIVARHMESKRLVMALDPVRTMISKSACVVYYRTYLSNRRWGSPVKNRYRCII